MVSITSPNQLVYKPSVASTCTATSFTPSLMPMANANSPVNKTIQHSSACWRSYWDQVYYGAGGLRHVLLIESEGEFGVNHPHMVPRRPAIELTEKEKLELQRQGIRPAEGDRGWNDLSLLKARYALDKERIVLEWDKKEEVTKRNVLRKIWQMMTGCSDENKEGAGIVLYYVGHGKRDTGDWCFKDGFITFEDLTTIYMDTMRGHVLTIVTDCSHSGAWVRDCMNFLDQQGVGPCGHLAKEKRILIKVFASCLSHQIPRKLAYSVHGCRNRRRSGLLTCLAQRRSPLGLWNFFAQRSGLLVHLVQERISIRARIAKDQYAFALDGTRLRCGVKSINTPCIFPLDCKGYWQVWSVLQRIFTLRGRQNRKEVWHILLVPDDHQLLAELVEKTQGENSGRFTINQEKYGEVLKSGSGAEGPSSGVLRQVKKSCVQSKIGQPKFSVVDDMTDLFYSVVTAPTNGHSKVVPYEEDGQPVDRNSYGEVVPFSDASGEFSGTSAELPPLVTTPFGGGSGTQLPPLATGHSKVVPFKDDDGTSLPVPSCSIEIVET